MPHRVVHLDLIDSTNAEAMRRASGGERGPLWIVAARQSAGRGRQGRSWASEAGNLHATLLITVPAPADVAAQTSFVAALAVFDLAAGLLASPEKLALKWPNDVLLDNAKLSGILIETTAQDRPDRTTVAIGIGVNLVHAPAPRHARYRTTSLARHGCRVEPAEAFARLAEVMAARLALWNDGGNFAVIRRDWTARAAGLGRLASVTTGERTVIGHITGLSNDGALLLSEPGGRMHAIRAGEVSLAPDSAIGSAGAS